MYNITLIVLIFVSNEYRCSTDAGNPPSVYRRPRWRDVGLLPSLRFCRSRRLVDRLYTRACAVALTSTSMNPCKWRRRCGVDGDCAAERDDCRTAARVCVFVLSVECDVILASPALTTVYDKTKKRIIDRAVGSIHNCTVSSIENKH